tara:strand:- start:356 stop:1846 length:1491 start_codon:yes stop_codon:yes gene_type:complete
MADDLKPLIAEIQKTNALTAELLKEKKADDTAKQLLLGNLFEIVNARDLFSKQQDAFKEGIVSRSEEEEKYDKSQPGLVGQAFQSVAKDTLIGSSASEGNIAFLGKTMLQLLKVQTDFSRITFTFYREQFAMQRFMLEMRGVPTKVFEGVTEVVELFNSALPQFQKGNDAMVKQLNKSFKTIDKKVLSTVENIPDPATLMGGKTAKEIEQQEDEKTFLEKTINAIIHPIDTLKSGIGKLGKTFTIGNAALVTVLTLIISGLFAFFPKFSGFLADLVTIIGRLLQSDFAGAGDLAADNIGGIVILGLIAFRKKVMKFFMAKVMPKITASYIGVMTKAFVGAFMSAGKIFLNLNPAARIAQILLAVLAVFGKSIVDGFKKGGIKGAIAAVLTQIFDMIGSVIKALGSGLSYLLGGATYDDLEGKYMGGPVAAGTPYIVGEKGPELFVPGSAGGIVPNGMGGGQPIIVNNNSVNQSSASHNHQHSNVSITDSQQEITGL